MCPSKKRKKRKSILLPLSVKIFIISITPLLFISLLWFFLKGGDSSYQETISNNLHNLKIQENFLTPNKYSRPQTALEKVNNIVIHYTANPGSDALANRNYFESLKDSQTIYASSHFIIGLDGTIVQCIPLNEISYASNERNKDTVSIECCHPKKNGKFTKETYQSLLQLCSYLCQAYNLSGSDLIRHYDVTGKLCPRYYVEHPKKWEELKNDVNSLLP